MWFFVDRGDSKTMFGAPASRWTSDAVRKTKTLNTQFFKFLSYELHRYKVEVTM